MLCNAVMTCSMWTCVVVTVMRGMVQPFLYIWVCSCVLQCWRKAFKPITLVKAYQIDIDSTRVSFSWLPSASWVVDLRFVCNVHARQTHCSAVYSVTLFNLMGSEQLPVFDHAQFSRCVCAYWHLAYDFCITSISSQKQLTTNQKDTAANSL
jgi:hypothetical protein